MNVHNRMINKKTSDGWNNVYKGIGQKRDITTSTSYQFTQLKSILRNELNALYTKNWIAAKAVDIPIDDATKDKREIQIENPNDLEVYKLALNAFNVDGKIKDLFKWSKVFGSAVIVIVSDDAKMSEPFNVEMMKKGNLKNIAVLDRFDIEIVNIDKNPLSPRYLMPESYCINQSSEVIHYTRVIQIDGVNTTNYNRELLNGFGLSLYEKIIPEIMNATLSPQLMINLLTQSNIDVFKIAGLNDALTDGNDDLVMKRLETIMTGKSIFNGISLDKEDEYTNISKTFAGLKDINTEFYQVVCGAVDIPYSRFMGATSTGLNSTGEGDLKNYYDKVVSVQRDMYQVYDLIDKVLQMHLFGKLIDGFKWEFPSLFQMSDEQLSIINNRDAQTKEIYLRNGVITEIEAKANLVENPMFPTITAESFEEDKETLNDLDNVDLDSE